MFLSRYLGRGLIRTGNKQSFNPQSNIEKMTNDIYPININLSENTCRIQFLI